MRPRSDQTRPPGNDVQRRAELVGDSRCQPADCPQAVRVAELEKRQTVGEKQAGFERDTQVKEAERDMRVAVS